MARRTIGLVDPLKAIRASGGMDREASRPRRSYYAGNNPSVTENPEAGPPSHYTAKELADARSYKHQPAVTEVRVSRRSRSKKT